MIVALLALVFAAAAVPQDAPVPEDARHAIAAANADWLPALKARDAETIAAPYAEDGIFVTPAGEAVTGRPAIARLMRERMARMGTVKGGELVQDGLIRQGTLLYEWGHAALELAPEGAAPSHFAGRYVTVWRKSAAGRWEIIRNLSLPE